MKQKTTGEQENTLYRSSLAAVLAWVLVSVFPSSFLIKPKRLLKVNQTRRSPLPFPLFLTLLLWQLPTATRALAATTNPPPSPPPHPSQAPVVQAHDPELDGDGAASSTSTAPATIAAQDPDLDAPQKPGGDGNDPSSLENTTLSEQSAVLEEFEELNTYHQSVSFGLGGVRNSAPPTVGGTTYFVAFNLRYSYDLAHLLLLQEASLQDALTLEGSVFFYRTLSFAATTDAYNLISWLGALRYTVQFSREVSVFFYGGMIKGTVLSSNNGSSTLVSNLQTFLPAAGAGFFYQLGPTWNLRGDIGYEAMTLNLAFIF